MRWGVPLAMVGQTFQVHVKRPERMRLAKSSGLLTALDLLQCC